MGWSITYKINLLALIFLYQWLVCGMLKLALINLRPDVNLEIFSSTWNLLEITFKSILLYLHARFLVFGWLTTRKNKHICKKKWSRLKKYGKCKKINKSKKKYKNTKIFLLSSTKSLYADTTWLEIVRKKASYQISYK